MGSGFLILRFCEFLANLRQESWFLPDFRQKSEKKSKQDGIEWTGDGYKMVDNNNGRIKQIEMKWNEWNEMEWTVWYKETKYEV